MPFSVLVLKHFWVLVACYNQAEAEVLYKTNPRNSENENKRLELGLWIFYRQEKVNHMHQKLFEIFG